MWYCSSNDSGRRLVAKGRFTVRRFQRCLYSSVRSHSRSHAGAGADKYDDADAGVTTTQTPPQYASDELLPSKQMIHSRYDQPRHHQSWHYRCDA